MGCLSCLLYTRILIYIGTIVLHFTNIVVMLNSFHGEPMKLEELRNFSQMQIYFLTCWNFTFQILYAALAVFCDCMILRNVSEKRSALLENVLKFRDSVFTVFVWPSSLFVTIFFWGFFAYDRNLLYPEYIDTVITPASNHIMHTFILPIVLLELVLNPRRKPDSHVVRLGCVLGIEAVYLCVLLFAYKTTGIWVYPILGQMYGTVFFPIFFVIVALCLSVLYYTQYCVSSVVFKCRESLGKRFCRAYNSTL